MATTAPGSAGCEQQGKVPAPLGMGRTEALRRVLQHQPRAASTGGWGLWLRLWDRSSDPK